MAQRADTLRNSEADSIEHNASGLRTHRLRDPHGMVAQTVNDAGAMKRADLIALASPPCHECGAPVQRIETRWHLDEDCRWRPGPYFMVCADEHRVLVQALE